MILWTDGSAEPNPGPGGWAVIDAATKSPILTGSEDHTTNIRMEGTAIREAIKYAIKADSSVEIYTDSEFWINVLTKWAPTWRSRGWTKKNGEIKNLDLVQALYTAFKAHSDTKLEWTRGHVGTEGNELADEWANKARAGAKIINGEVIVGGEPVKF